MVGACSTYGEMIGAYRELLGHLRERDHLQGLCVKGVIILKWM
jgi:hypothetical protein